MAPNDMGQKFEEATSERPSDSDEPHYSEPSFDPKWSAQLQKAAQMTLEERIQMRIKHGVGWQWRL